MIETKKTVRVICAKCRYRQIVHYYYREDVPGDEVAKRRVILEFLGFYERLGTYLCEGCRKRLDAP